jgi:hypothetical protein
LWSFKKRDASTSSATGEDRREKMGTEKIEEYHKNRSTSRCLRPSKAALKERENGKRDASTSSATGKIEERREETGKEKIEKI